MKVLGAWAFLTYPVWGSALNVCVSRNKKARKRRASKAWEQDVPFAECFDEMEDDL